MKTPAFPSLASGTSETHSTSKKLLFPRRGSWSRSVLVFPKCTGCTIRKANYSTYTSVLYSKIPFQIRHKPGSWKKIPGIFSWDIIKFYNKINLNPSPLWDKVSIFSSSLSWTYYVDQASFKLKEFYLPPPPKWWVKVSATIFILSNHVWISPIQYQYSTVKSKSTICKSIDCNNFFC